MPSHRVIDRQISNLALPALGALIAEPLFLIVDSAMVGHLGASSLAGLAIAGSILQTAVGLMVFLAYATTPLAARRSGAGDHRGAIQAGIDGLFLALGIGVLLTLALWLSSGWVVGLFQTSGETASGAQTYLAISSLGVPAMLLVFAATGLLRGLQDTRTPLIVAGIGFGANALLNWFFIYGVGLGLAGAAVGTVLAQWGMVAAYGVIVLRHLRAHNLRFRPEREGLSQVGTSGWWLFIRTVGLRAAMLLTVAAAASYGTNITAGYQIIFTLLATAAYALDSLAIAAQALIGNTLGAGDLPRTRAVIRRTIWWGLWFGAGGGAALIAASPFLGRIFTDDSQVLNLLPASLIGVGIALPLAGYVYVLDGILMGANDARYLAWTSLINLFAYSVILWGVTVLVPTGAHALLGITLAWMLGFMAARALTLGLRIKNDRWIVLGS